MKHKVYLVVPKEITILRERSKQAVRGRIRNELQQRFLNFEQRQSNIEKLIYESKINAACDTVWKWRFVKGEINLHQYLIKEAETFQNKV